MYILDIALDHKKERRKELKKNQGYYIAIFGVWYVQILLVYKMNK